MTDFGSWRELMSIALKKKNLDHIFFVVFRHLQIIRTIFQLDVQSVMLLNKQIY